MPLREHQGHLQAVQGLPAVCPPEAVVVVRCVQKGVYLSAREASAEVQEVQEVQEGGKELL